MGGQDIGLRDVAVRTFGPLFTRETDYFKTGDGTGLTIFDAPTQFFVFGGVKSSIYGQMGEHHKQAINKILKENDLDKLEKEQITLEIITQFRRMFWNMPEIQTEIMDAVEGSGAKSEVELFNIFATETVAYKIYTDSDLSMLREFRVYIAKQGVVDQKSEGYGSLKSELYYFLKFDRFNLDEYIIRRADETLDFICSEIENGNCPDIRQFRSYDDRDKLPDDILNEIERLVLLGYCDKPDQKVVDETRVAIEKFDIGQLKEFMGFDPRGWQRYALAYESRENLAVNSRRSGKSYLVVYVAIRQIFLPGQMILYLLPVKEDYSEQPFFYIEQMLENVKKLGAELPGFQFNAKQFRVVSKISKSKIIFLSGQGSSKGKSFSSNLNIIDEAAMIDDKNLYDQIYNSTADTRGRTWAISTINVDTPTNWFFYKKVILEGGDDSVVHNVSIYDNPFMKEAEKKRTEMAYKGRNNDVWLSDRMAQFVGQVDGFDTSKFFKIDFLYDVMSFKGQKFNICRNLESYSRFMLFYDPAKNKDKAGISVMGLIGNKAEVVMTGYINIKNYYAQWEVIVEMMEYLKKIRHTEFGLDLGKAGEAAFDRFEKRGYSPYGVLSTGGMTLTKETYRRWRVPASDMETGFNALMAAGVVTGFSWLDGIKNEFDTYALAKMRSSKVDHHNDILSSLFNASYIRYERGYIKIDAKEEIKRVERIDVDEHGRPIRRVGSGRFDGNMLSKFLY